MAVEILKQRSIYDPPSLKKKKKFDEVIMITDFHDGIHHNYEHDLESVFWILLWILLERFICGRSAEDEKILAGDLSQIFQNSSECSIFREGILLDNGRLSTILLRWLTHDLEDVARRVEFLRVVLKDGYKDRALALEDNDTYSPLYTQFIQTLRGCVQTVEKMTLPNLRLSSSQTGDQGVTEQAEAKQATAAPATRPFQVKRPRGATGTKEADEEEYVPKTPRTQHNATASSARMTLRSSNANI